MQKEWQKFDGAVRLCSIMWLDPKSHRQPKGLLSAALKFYLHRSIESSFKNFSSTKNVWLPWTEQTDRFLVCNFQPPSSFVSFVMKKLSPQPVPQNQTNCLHRSIKNCTIYRSVQTEFYWSHWWKTLGLVMGFWVKSRDWAECGCGLPYMAICHEYLFILQFCGCPSWRDIWHCVSVLQ